MSGNRWDVMSIREYTDRTGNPKTSWTKIGAAFTNQNGSINVQLDCIPIDGKMQLQVPLTKEEREAKFGGTGQAFRQNQQYQGGDRGARPIQGQGWQGQGPQHHRGPANNANRFRGQSQPQQQQFGQQAAPPAYSPDPNAQFPGDHDANEDPYPGSRIGQSQWDINGQIIDDARHLPNDHPDFLPF